MPFKIEIQGEICSGSYSFTDTKENGCREGYCTHIFMSDQHSAGARVSLA